MKLWMDLILHASTMQHPRPYQLLFGTNYFCLILPLLVVLFIMSFNN